MSHVSRCRSLCLLDGAHHSGFTPDMNSSQTLFSWQAGLQPQLLAPHCPRGLSRASRSPLLALAYLLARLFFLHFVLGCLWWFVVIFWQPPPKNDKSPDSSFLFGWPTKKNDNSDDLLFFLLVHFAFGGSGGPKELPLGGPKT